MKIVSFQDVGRVTYLWSWVRGARLVSGVRSSWQHTIWSECVFEDNGGGEKAAKLVEPCGYGKEIGPPNGQRRDDWMSRE